MLVWSVDADGAESFSGSVFELWPKAKPLQPMTYLKGVCCLMTMT